VKIASPSATFTVNDPLTGILPGWGLSHSLTRCAGQSSALEMIWSGRTLNAAEAHAKGLVDRIIDDESSEEEIEAFCRQLTNIPQPAAHLAKLAMQQTGQLDQTSILDLEIEAQQQCWASDETAQGLNALNTNTEPDFI
jgi:enoyl-CoA hydratase/carnithine racemase